MHLRCTSALENKTSGLLVLFVCLFLVKPYERMSLEELKEAEDDFDEADRKAIEMYRCSKIY